MSEFIPFRFVVSLCDKDTNNVICKGAFSEVTGFEASMSPKTLKEGGRNWGEVQLAGVTTFSTLVLKRGVTELRHLHSWFDITTRQANYGYRLTGTIEVYDRGTVDPENPAEPALRWQIDQAMAVKFKGPDLSSTSSQVAIEELHLVHEGLHLLPTEQQEVTNG